MTAIVLRAAAPGDAPVIFQMLKDLAESVGEAEAFDSSAADVRRDGFGPDRRYEAILAEADGRVAGLLVVFATYSTYRGRPCLCVNDLYVAPWARGLKLGRLLMARACRLAVERGCCRVELRVLRDNPARRFYESIGMVASDELTYVLRDQTMEAMAKQ